MARPFVTYTTTEAAKYIGKNPVTLKRYELLGLIKPKRNKQNNYRVYLLRDLKDLKKRLETLKRANNDKVYILKKDLRGSNGKRKGTGRRLTGKTV